MNRIIEFAGLFWAGIIDIEYAEQELGYIPDYFYEYVRYLDKGYSTPPTLWARVKNIFHILKLRMA